MEVGSIVKSVLGSSVDSELLEYIESVVCNESLSFDESYETLAPLLGELSNKGEEETKKLFSELFEKLGRTTKSETKGNEPKRLQQVVRIEGKEEPSAPTSKEKGQQHQKTESPKKEGSQPIQNTFLSSRETAKVESFVETRNVRFQNDSMRHNSRDIFLRGFSLSNGSTELLENADLKILEGHKYGLVGRNGVGKTTLMRQIASGKINQFPAHLRTMLVEQEATGDPNTTVLECMLQADSEQDDLLRRLKELEVSDGDHSEEIKDIYDKLGQLDADGSKARAISILSGLGFSSEMHGKSTSELSGGWRMRLALACALFSRPHLLLLDEPTNHLDLPAVVWLERYLKDLEITLVVVSHDRAFLNSVATDIMYFNNKKLKYHPGNFDSFVHRKEEKLKEQQRTRDKDEKKQRQIKDQIEKYKQQTRAHGAADQKMGMVRSRKKMLAKVGGPQLVQGSAKTLFDTGWVWGGEALMELEEEANDPAFRFRFPEPEYLGVHGPLLQLSHVSFGYTPKKRLFTDVTLDIGLQSRIAILGPNGIGKSTLMQIILGELQPSEGEVYRHRNLQIGYFSQHFVDSLDMDMSPLQHLTKLFPDQKEDKLRAHLGSFGLSGKLAVQKIDTLSGGQKSRVVFASITWKKPQVLLLDEPTNHLDMNTIDAVIGAIMGFQGGILLTSHDQHLIRSIEPEIWTVQRGKVVPWQGSFDEYVESLSQATF